jgi:hypothetical protein
VNFCEHVAAQVQKKMLGVKEQDSGVKKKIKSSSGTRNYTNFNLKASALRFTLNIDGSPIISKSHTHPSHSQVVHLLISSLSLGVPVPRVTQYIRGM